jgi:hypothetical protein
MGEKRVGEDYGYLFVGPTVERKSKVVKPGVVLIDNHKSGVIVSENTDSPWNKATYYAHGSILSDTEGKFIRQVAFCETIDPDGDVTWSILWEPSTGKASYHFIVGTGKWKGIAGKATITSTESRADDHTMLSYRMNWEIDEKNDEIVPAFSPKGPYTNHATSLSFHGPHVTEEIKELANGLRLIINTQLGVLIGEDSPASNVLNPRGYAASYDKGVTVWKGDGRLADVMLLEDTDPDGDIAWLVHVWWYARGRGLYKFIGGTGKWEGIRGEGTTLGQLMKRSDDYHLLRSEIHWRIENLS